MMLKMHRQIHGRSFGLKCNVAPPTPSKRLHLIRCLATQNADNNSTRIAPSTSQAARSIDDGSASLQHQNTAESAAHQASTGSNVHSHSNDPSTSSHSSKKQGNPPPPPDQQLPLLLRILARLPAPPWLSSFVSAVHKRDNNAIKLLRMLFIGMLFIVIACTRQVFDTRPAGRPLEVMYSDFVTLLDRGRVKAVRLESGTGKMYFDITPKPAETATQQATASATQPSSTATTVAGQPAQNPGLVATAATGTALAAEAVSSAQGTTASSPAATATTATPSQSVSRTRFQKQFVVKLADKHDILLTQRILQAGVEFAVIQKGVGSAIANVVVTTLAVWIPLLPVFFFLRKILEDRTGSKRKKPAGKPSQPSITFKDVAGVESAKEELMEVVTVMKASKSAYNKLNVKMPSGVLLCGPPGTGKTLLAKAVAGEAGVPFFAFSASEFVELYVGRGAARIREVFGEARKASPCVVFIDELDAVGARRGMGYNDERDQTLNQLLTELDGFEGRQGILFLAATNRIEILDSALLRPGRINRKINVPLPNEEGRRAILGVHLRNTPMTSKEDKVDACERLAKVTAGFSGAELANVVNEATLLAAREGLDVVTIRQLLEGANRTRNGVNGAGRTGIAAGIQKWLMDSVANAPSDNGRVKNAAVS